MPNIYYSSGDIIIPDVSNDITITSSAITTAPVNQIRTSIPDIYGEEQIPVPAIDGLGWETGYRVRSSTAELTGDEVSCSA